MVINFRSKNRSRGFSSLITMVVLAVMSVALVQTATAAAKPKTFKSAEAAVKAVVTAARGDNVNELITIFGAAGKDLLSSGDAVADKQGRDRFLADYDQKHKLVPKGSGKVLVLGTNDWPFPIPLVKKGKMWSFDTNRGKQELLNRRIGQNELEVIQVCLAIVDAQREYAMSDQGTDGLREYAQKFRSDPGTKNGLYWKTNEGEKPSPLGPFAAQASKMGYKSLNSSKPSPYRGYYFRILKAQGKHAQGGAFSYVVKGHMIGGFAVVAFPAQYGNSGVMTFIVNHGGVVYQKNLGKNTAKLAEGMAVYDPDPSWKNAK